LVLILILGFVFPQTRFKSAGARALLAFILSGVLAQIIKHLVGRPRPRLLTEGIHHFGPTLASGLDSFPSGHAASAVAVATALSFYYPRATPLFMFIASFIAASRIFSGTHFPIDILGGTILGLSVGLIISSYGRRSRAISFYGESDQ
ncbi:MAG: phosphatase PAP2 family protein, partial [Deltaproteobacteria bacterium]|nr:phosphatase PAP2 family protein [Deltaproteobacteria bacterium]